MIGNIASLKYDEDNDCQNLETVTEKSHSSKYGGEKVFLDQRSISVMLH